MFNWRRQAETLLGTHEVFCLIHIVKTEGSTPRDAGTIMLVTHTDEYGTIGGGNLENAAIKSARKCLKNKVKAAQTLDYILGPDVEQCCGGRVVLALRNIESVTELPQTDGPAHSPLYLFGAGHVGTALMHTLAPLPFALNCFDNRPKKAADNVKIFTDPAPVLASAPKQALFLIMTHDHALDYRLVNAALKRDDFAFLGLIGSKTKRARFVSRLKKDGFSAAQISRLTCPIGVEGIQGKEPEIIAASVAAQLLQMIGH